MFPKMCEIKLIDNRVETSLSTHTLRPGGRGQRQPSPGPLSDIQHLESEYSNQQPMKAGWGYHPGHQPSHGWWWGTEIGEICKFYSEKL